MLYTSFTKADRIQDTHDNWAIRSQNAWFHVAYEKFCRGCSTTKPIDEFYKSQYHAGGHRPRCKECLRKQTIERQRQPEVKARRKEIRKKGRKYISISVEKLKEIETLLKRGEIGLALGVILTHKGQ